MSFDHPISRKATGSLKWDRYLDTDILPMWVADMDFEVAKPIQDAIKRRIEHPVYGYTVAPKSLDNAIIEFLSEHYGWKIEADWLVYLPGVVTGLAVSCRAFCEDGDDIMVNPPIYHHFYNSHEDKRQQLVKVPLHREGDRWTYNIEAMQAACHPKMTMLMMCSPHNPTGTVFTKDELRQVAKMCAQHNMTMISDEIHCDLVIDKQVKHIPTAVACPEHADNIVTIMSGSKTWNIAGLNCSFAIISNEQRRQQFVKAAHAIVPGVPPLAYVATEAAYRDGEQWRQQLLTYLAGNFQTLSDAMPRLSGLKLQPSQATYLAWIDASELAMDDTQGFFEKHGVGLSSGEQFGQAQFIRLNFACPRDTLNQVIDRMEAAIKTL
ncbi:MAG: PatB family C-S lyase [Granulosicoccaceae bacterium]